LYSFTSDFDWKLSSLEVAWVDFSKYPTIDRNFFIAANAPGTFFAEYIDE
jgi:hypothetical protein